MCTVLYELIHHHAMLSTDYNKTNSTISTTAVEYWVSCFKTMTIIWLCLTSWCPFWWKEEWRKHLMGIWLGCTYSKLEQHFLLIWYQHSTSEWNQRIIIFGLLFVITNSESKMSLTFTGGFVLWCNLCWNRFSLLFLWQQLPVKLNYKYQKRKSLKIRRNYT